MKYIFVALFMLLPFVKLHAQFGYQCVDSTRKQSNSTCGALGYYPVCGCNDKTYRNECFMYSDGVQNQKTLGPCEAFAFDFYPNVITDANASFFKPIILTKDPKITGRIYVIDVFSNIFINRPIYTYNTYWQGIPAFQEEIDLSDLRKGMYIFVFEAAGTILIKKLIRAE